MEASLCIHRAAQISVGTWVLNAGSLFVCQKACGYFIAYLFTILCSHNRQFCEHLDTSAELNGKTLLEP